MNDRQREFVLIVNLGYWLHPDSHRIARTITVPDDTTEVAIDRIASRLGLHVISTRKERS